MNDPREQAQQGVDYIKSRYGATASTISTGTGTVINSEGMWQNGRFYPNAAISKRTVKTIKSYDDQGRLTEEETIEEIEYSPAQPYYPWYQSPVISSSERTGSIHKSSDFPGVTIN